MEQWFRNRAGVTVLGSSWLAAGLSVPGTGFLVAFPNLTGGPSMAAPASALLPLVAVMAYSYGIARQNTMLESLALRHVWLADVMLAGLCLLPFALGMTIFGGPELIAAFRNALGYFGAALVSASLMGLSTSALFPLLWAIAASMGLLPLGDPLWTWPLAQVDRPLSWAAPVILALLGPVVYASRSNRLVVTTLLPVLRTPASGARSRDA